MVRDAEIEFADPLRDMLVPVNDGEAFGDRPV